MSNNDFTPVWHGPRDFHETVRALYEAGILGFTGEPPAYLEQFAQDRPAAPVIDIRTRERIG